MQNRAPYNILYVYKYYVIWEMRFKHAQILTKEGWNIGKVKAYIVGVLTLVTISAAIYFCFSFENRMSSYSLNVEVNSYDVNTSDKDHVLSLIHI